MKRHFCSGWLMRKFAFLLVILILAACEGRGIRPEDIPTLASVDDLATALPLTQNAPPSPFDRTLTQFTEIDNGLTELSGWRYVVQLEFDGVFARTPRETAASAQAEVSFNQVASARRVLVNTAGELIGAPEGGEAAYEAVRLGPDAFIVRDGACSTGRSAANTAADLRAGELVGGVRSATPAGRRATINGVDVYAYSFTADDLVLPAIRPADGGALALDSGELWVSPEYGVVVRFYLNLNVENVVIFERALPVSGRVIMRYDLYDAGTAFNITVPFGC